MQPNFEIKPECPTQAMSQYGTLEVRNQQLAYFYKHLTLDFLLLRNVCKVGSV